MIRRSWLFVLLLLVPAIAFAVSLAVQGQLNAEFTSALRAQFPNADPIKLASVTLDKACANADVRAQLAESCDTNASLNSMRVAADWSVGVALALLAAIWLAGLLAQYNRSLLVYVFRPGLYLTILILLGLVIAHAGLAIATIYFGESALISQIQPGLMLAIGFGALLGVLAMVVSSLSLVTKAQVTVIGRTVDRSEALELWARIDRAAARLNALVPEHLVLGLEPNFFVTEADVVCLTGKLKGRTLYCSLPLGRILSEDEFDSIVGHELGHFKGADTKFSERFYPIYRGTLESLQSLRAIGSDGARGIALLPAIATLSFFYESFAVAEKRLSRERELVADSVGAQLTSPKILATALVKVHAFASIWSGFDGAATEALRKGKAYTNASALFAAAVAANATSSALEGLADRTMAHPTDSHPPLQVRLAALKQELPSLGTGPLEVAPVVTAMATIPNVVSFEEEVSGAYQAILAHRLGIKPNEEQEAAA